MEFTLSVPRYKYQKVLNKQEFLDVFPESMISHTLEMCPSDGVIELTMACVTPAVIDLIHKIVETRTTPLIQDQFRPIVEECGKYLGMEILMILGNKKYGHGYLHGHRDLNLFRIMDHPQKELIFTSAVFDGFPQLAEFLIKKGVDPSTEISPFQTTRHKNYAIGHACGNGTLSLVNLMLQDPRVDPSADANVSIRDAAYYGHLSVVRKLMADPRVDINSMGGMALTGACMTGHTDIVRLLLSDPRAVLPARTLFESYRHNRPVILTVLLEDPRIKTISCIGGTWIDSMHYIVHVVTGEKNGDRSDCLNVFKEWYKRHDLSWPL